MSAAKKTVAIVTGNSNSGSACIEELFTRYAGKMNVRAAFRSADKSKELAKKFPSLQVFVGIDAAKPSTLVEVFANCQAAFIITATTGNFADDATFTINMIQVAADAGIEYIILASSFTVISPTRMSSIAARFVPCEALLAKLGKEKNLKWTSLRGSYFMENLLHNKDAIKNQSTLFMCDGFYPVNHTRDIGKSAAACLVDAWELHDTRNYDINGPELLDGAAIAAVFSKVLGREIKFVALEASKLPPMLAQIANYMAEEGKGALPFMSDVRVLTGQHTHLEFFVREHLEDFQ